MISRHQRNAWWHRVHGTVASLRSLAAATVAQWSRSHCYLSHSNEKMDTFQLQAWVNPDNYSEVQIWLSYLVVGHSRLSSLVFFIRGPCFFFLILEGGGCKLAFLCILYTQGTPETHCVPCKYCVWECQVYVRCNMLLSSRLLCHMPPYCCFGCFHGKSLYRPGKEPILKAE